MSGLTKRFKLSRFGAGTPGTIGDSGQKYTSADRDTLDRLLAQTEVHDHHFRPADLSVGPAADAVLTLGAGTLRSGHTYYYRYSVVDELGIESLGSAVATVETPALLPAPGMPSPYVVGTDTGTLAPGMYYYALTAVRDTEETPLGSAVVMSIVAGEHAIRLTMPPLGDADAFRVWRMGYSEAGFTKLGLTTAAEFIDNGAVPADPCACDPGNQPPQVNTGVGRYGIVVTLPMSVDLTTAKAWRLYRSVYSTFPAASLVHEVVERADEWDPASALQRSWTDTGAPLVSGAPADSDQNMRFSPFVFDSASVAPSAAAYPDGYPMLIGGVLNVASAGAWVPIASGGTGGGGTATGGTSVLTAPSGDRFVLSVANDGTLTAVPTLLPGPPTAPQTY